MDRPRQRAILDSWQDDEDLHRERKIWRSHAVLLVVANGCFDLMTPGHVKLLTYARKCRSLRKSSLIQLVAINNDASANAIKGPSRPILPFEHRAAVVAGIKGVDWVVGFRETTPEGLFAIIEPDVLVKGSDFMGDIVPGQKQLVERGGIMLWCPMEEDWSTSKTICEIRAKFINDAVGP